MKYLLLTLLIFSLGRVHAQDTIPSESTKKVYDFPIGKMACFPGGEAKMMEFFEENLQWPNTQAHVIGRVILRFIVQTDGTLTDIEVVRSLHPLFDEEAVRVMKLMPKWEPARGLNNEIVEQRYTLPIIFHTK